jgi:hypothetical protein
MKNKPPEKKIMMALKNRNNRISLKIKTRQKKLEIRMSLSVAECYKFREMSYKTAFIPSSDNLDKNMLSPSQIEHRS